MFFNAIEDVNLNYVISEIEYYYCLGLWYLDELNVDLRIYSYFDFIGIFTYKSQTQPCNELERKMIAGWIFVIAIFIITVIHQNVNRVK